MSVNIEIYCDDTNNNENVKPKRQQLNINIPDELHTKFKSKAAANKTNMADIILQAIKTYCEDKE